MTKQIDIKELIPFMKDGYVAMDKDGDWYWFEQKPSISICDGNIWVRQNPSDFENVSKIFDIKPVSDWTKSLIRINESQNNLCTTDEQENKDESM